MPLCWKLLRKKSSIYVSSVLFFYILNWIFPLDPVEYWLRGTEKETAAGKRRRRSREAGAGPLMFESHRPPGCVFAASWKCTLSKGYSESWGDEWRSGRKRSIGAERSGSGDRCQSFIAAVATSTASVTATNSVNLRQMRVHFEAAKMRETDEVRRRGKWPGCSSLFLSPTLLPSTDHR